MNHDVNNKISREAVPIIRNLPKYFKNTKK